LMNMFESHPLRQFPVANSGPGRRRGAKLPVIALFSRYHPNPGDCGKRPKRSLNAFCL
jgi:hypothetical protein